MKYRQFAHISASLTILAFAVISACTPAPEPDQYNTLNLISLNHLAEKVSDTGIFNLRSEAKYFHLASGWSFPLREEGIDQLVIAATQPECELRFNTFSPTQRWLAFEFSPSGTRASVARQQISVRMGDTVLGTVEALGDEYQEYFFNIPHDLQVQGTNVITLEFTEFADYETFLEGSSHEIYAFPYARVAGYIKNIRIHPGTKNKPHLKTLRDESEAFKQSADGTRIVQNARSTLSYAFLLDSGAELSVAGSTDFPEDREEILTVAVETRHHPELIWTRLWSTDVTRDENDPEFFEATVRISPSSEPCQIRFVVDSTRRSSNAGIIWKKMDLLTPQHGAQGEDTGTREPIRAANVKHVVFIILDAARADYFGCYGFDKDTTPFMDSLAEEGLRFTNAVVAAPYTYASIGSLFTGLLPERHGLRWFGHVFPEDLPNMIKDFKAAGLYTALLAGHPDFLREDIGLGRDFDYATAIYHPDEDLGKTSRMDEDIIKAALRKTVDDGDRLFFYIHILPPHEPYYPPEPFDRMYIEDPEMDYRALWMYEILAFNKILDADSPEVDVPRRMYLNNLRYADHLVQYTIEQLKSLGIYDESLIILSADHGEGFLDHGFMQHTRSVYDEAIRVPLIVLNPGAEPAVIDQPVGLVDFYPTLAELLSLGSPVDTLDGRSIAPLLFGRTLEFDDYYYSRPAGANAVFSYRGNRFKYIQGSVRAFLFDLKNDPGERNNLVEEYPVMAAYLKMRGLLHITFNTRSTEEVPLDEEQLRTLKDLGYIH